MDDLISRQAAIKEIIRVYEYEYPTASGAFDEFVTMIVPNVIKNLPAAEPTLYGYKIEHLAYIATVMEKEGVTAEYAVRTFDDIGRVIKMLIEEVQAKVEEALNERFN